MPRNACTGRRYRGINVLALWCAARANGYADARWATYRQWGLLGAQVRRAERATLVLFYKELPRGAEAEPTDDAPSSPAPLTYLTSPSSTLPRRSQTRSLPVPPRTRCTRSTPSSPPPALRSDTAAPEPATCRPPTRSTCPRAPLPQAVDAPDYASDVATIVRHLGLGPSARRLTAELRRRQARLAQAAVDAGLEAARARQARAAGELSAIAAHLLLAPVQTHEDLAIKLAVLIAAGEAADDPLAFLAFTYARCWPTCT